MWQVRNLREALCFYFIFGQNMPFICVLPFLGLIEKLFFKPNTFIFVQRTFFQIEQKTFFKLAIQIFKFLHAIDLIIFIYVQKHKNFFSSSKTQNRPIT